MTALRADVLVIGGGPAGLSAAIRLARDGMRVMLCEANAYPHQKMCGEFLSPECAGLLSGLGAAEAVAAQLPTAIHTARITAPGGEEWFSHLPGTAWGLSRFTLDATLAGVARQAGVDVLERARVEAVSGNLAGGFKVNVQHNGQPRAISARMVIGAYGKRSNLDRALDRRFFKQRHPFMAFKAHFEGPPVPGRIELHGFPGGYCGLSEIEDGGLVACLLVHERVFQANGGAGGGVDAFISWMQSQNPFLGGWFARARRIYPRWISISQVCFDSKPAFERDVMMVGDAAGLITPLAGNGISMALEGGQLAGHHALAFLRNELSAPDLRRRYAAKWAQTFRARLALGRLLQPLMLRPAYLRLAVRLLRRVPAVGRYLVAHTRGGIVSRSIEGDIERIHI